MQLTRHLDNIDASIVHVSHQPDTFLDYERVLWLEAGELVLDGSPDVVLPAFKKRMRELGCSDAVL